MLSLSHSLFHVLTKVKHLIELEGEDSITSAIEEELLEHILRKLRLIPVQDVGQTGITESLQEVSQLTDALSQYPPQQWLGAGIQKEASLVRTLLEATDLEELARAVEEVQQRVEKVEENSDEHDSLSLFLSKHKIGVALFAFAKEKVDAQQDLVVCDAEINVMREALEELKEVESDALEVCRLVRSIHPETVRFKEERGKLASPSQLKSMQELLKSLWIVAEAKLLEQVRNVSATCLEHWLEAIGNKGKVQESTDQTMQINFKESADSFQMSKVFKHIIWKECVADLSSSLCSSLKKWEASLVELSCLTAFCFLLTPAAHVAFQNELPPMPSAEALDKWCSGSETFLRAVLDQDDFQILWPRFEATFLPFMQKSLHRKTVAVFEVVGELVQACMSGAPHMEANCKAIDAADKDLPTNLEFRMLLDCFLKARHLIALSPLAKF